MVYTQTHIKKPTHIKKTTTTIRTTKNKQTKKETKKKIIELLTEAPELVTLDCSFTHVLQAPSTQPYHR